MGESKFVPILPKWGSAPWEVGIVGAEGQSCDMRGQVAIYWSTGTPRESQGWEIQTTSVLSLRSPADCLNPIQRVLGEIQKVQRNGDGETKRDRDT